MLENPQDLEEVCPTAVDLEGTRGNADNQDENVNPVEEGQGISESQPYPYSLRPLPGRHNYDSGKVTNK